MYVTFELQLLCTAESSMYAIKKKLWQKLKGHDGIYSCLHARMHHTFDLICNHIAPPVILFVNCMVGISIHKFQMCLSYYDYFLYESIWLHWMSNNCTANLNVVERSRSML